MSTSEQALSPTDILCNANRIKRRLQSMLKDFRHVRDQGKRALENVSEIPLFKGMLRTLDTEYAQFESLWRELLDMDEEQGIQLLVDSTDHDLRDQARRYFHEANAAAEGLVTTSRTSVLGHSLPSGPCLASQGRRSLPPIPIPTFDGKRASWRRFKRNFSSLVERDLTLTESDKFHYLSGALVGSAAALISKLEHSEKNFEIAWELLNKTYDNPRLLAGAYLDEVLDKVPLQRRPSSDNLDHLISHLSENVSAFLSFDIPDKTDFLLLHIARRCLDPQTREEFEAAHHGKFPTFNDLIDYLRKLCDAREMSQGIKLHGPRFSQQGSSHHPHKGGQNQRSRPFNSCCSQINSQNAPSKGEFSSASVCFICKELHSLYSCEKFKALSVEERIQALNNWKGCRNCLSESHQSRTCKSRFRCKHCHAKHHSLLHKTSASPEQKGSTASTSVTCNMALRDSKHTPLFPQTIMGTAVGHLLDSANHLQPVRLVFDSASHVSFITKHCAERCGLTLQPLNICIKGIADTPLDGFRFQTTCILFSDLLRSVKLSAQVVVVDRIMSPQPRFNVRDELHNHYQSYHLADPDFCVPGPVDFLLGCDLFGDVITGEVITIAHNLPKLIGTVFGYTVIGRLGDVEEVNACVSDITTTSRDQDEELHKELHRFWAIDDPPNVKLIHPAEEQLEEWFQSSHSRLPSGRYVIRLPFKETPPEFPGHRAIATRRLMHMESKLSRNAQLRELYTKCLQEYIDLEHMELTANSGKYCLPHHSVAQGNPMKIRVVFDASSNTKNGSLNQWLHVGPKLQNDLASILLNFRLHWVAFTVDMVKMYRQIVVHPLDRPYQHVLWRKDPSEMVQEYELRTLPFGLSCAPYLALRVARQLVQDEGGPFPRASLAILQDMYIDDLVTGASSLEEALQLQQEISQIMTKGCFPLSKWASNQPEILAAVSSHQGVSVQKEPLSLDLEAETFVKILGLQWDTQGDTFSYAVDLPRPVFTKRGALSVVAKLYDPLGFVSPFTVLAKVLIQEAWKEGLQWDSPFPEKLHKEWSDWLEELPVLIELRIPRRISPVAPESTHILIFADASTVAYCAAAYLRTQSNGSTSSHLLLARTRLAPVRQMTVPRLELCAALLAARMLKNLSGFKERIHGAVKVQMFTDSMVVLGWINNPSQKLPVFVANRISQILEVTSSHQWSHVSSSDNPSDIGSRGLLPRQLIKSNLWFEGPPWIKGNPEEWPSGRPIPSACLSYELEASPCVLSAATIINPSRLFIDWMERFSNWHRLIRSMAYVLRFCGNAKRKDKPRSVGSLSHGEIVMGTNACCKVVQVDYFFNSNLPHANSNIPSKLLPLSPFIDSTGMLRVGGRLKNTNLSWDHKHPILLPKNSHLARLIVEWYHRILLHPGHTLLIATVRLRFWIIGLRDLTRQVARRCIDCQKGSSSPQPPIMGVLPSCRFHEDRAFLHVGVDFGGPFIIKESTRRNAATSKAYLSLFVCMSTKAIHLEAVSTLSTPSFLASLERFIGRRGLPNTMYSDNGTNMVGAARKLEDWFRWHTSANVKDSLHEFATTKGFQWKFIPPQAPHFGGLWEAGIKSAKRLLKHQYGEGRMTFEEFSTLLIRVEAILNSRPLCPLSNDPNDLDYLSPAHFLIGSTLLSIPEPSVLDSAPHVLKRWERVSHTAQHFWARWRTEYLSTLQVKSKWHRPAPNLEVGDLVFMRDERVHRLYWPRGRVIAVHPGSDGVVRVADIRTANGTYRRPATKLVPLLLPPDDKKMKP